MTFRAAEDWLDLIENLAREEGADMLVLSRKINQAIDIDGGRIRVVIVDVDRGKVRVGIEADPSIRVYREELLPFVEKGAGHAD